MFGHMCCTLEFRGRVLIYVCDVYVFFFKQKTAYEMRISDWSSDVCSSDLVGVYPLATLDPLLGAGPGGDHPLTGGREGRFAPRQIGRASCRERVCQYV